MDVIGNDAAAEAVGLASRTWTAYRARSKDAGYPPPEPYRHEISHGHALPVWHRAELEEWAAARPGRGSPGRPRRVNRSADTDQAERMPPSQP